MFCREGRSRRFAFIGFRTEQEAQEAIKYFNKSFLDTSRISVEIAHEVGDENAPRPKSRHSLKNVGKVNQNSEKSYNRSLRKIDKKIKKKPEDDDPLFSEFLEVMQRGTSRFWSNDMSIAPTAQATPKEKVLAKNDDADLAGNDDVEADADSHDADIDDVLQTGRLFVRNLPYTATEEELMEHFSKFGEISEAHLVLDKETKRSKGFAYILFLIPESAARAMEDLDKSTFQGRLLHVMPAKHREKQVNEACNLPKTLKQKREEEKKASEAGGNTKAWNSLFMCSNTIVEHTARVYGVRKSDLLDRETEDPAVLVALAETKVIAETKEALAKAGVNVTCLEEIATGKGDKKKRSKHILLVKNLPFGSTEKELAQVFGRFGSLDKIIFPPPKTLALVVFLEPAEAKAAMAGMAYKRYKDSPLFLEWAPADILEPKTLAPVYNELNSDVRETDTNVVYVTNLSFKTSDESLKKHLTQVVKQGNIQSVKIIKHVKDGKKVSKGYGFVEFDSIETATSAFRDVQGTVLDGHALTLRFSEDEPVVKGSDKDKKTCTKLVVRNLPFNGVDKKQLRKLFSPFGQIKGVRLPTRDSTGRFAGFGFVEFMTKQEASNAKKALSSTHLYGRRLGIEYSNDDTSLEALRDRSAAKYYKDQEKANPKRRRIAY
ncbi:unnamed protein product [Microthlaspi erraticum]|uniref:RRM domain-containing protein n=1 Tax=Microthlaspi erraticum TaxID=1685480 RepID=A0A6D2IP60_9BRAS|nr:unnamed protein product [Microthlaspi erraticum]